MRITESTLRQLIRETLLMEAAITPETALEMGINFQVNRDESSIEIVASRGEDYVGELTASKTDLPCKGAWNITWSVADINGLGPIMYDLVMDAISPSPLMADREQVSEDAWRVWNFYLKNRPDIEAIQLDDPLNTLTSDVDDNCSQVSAVWYAKEQDGTWQESPLSKAYRRKDGRTPTMNKLWRLGIVEIDG